MTHERDNGATWALDRIGWIDFETAGPLDLRRVGAYRYAESARAIQLVFAFGDGPVKTCINFQGLTWGALPKAVRDFHARVRRGEAIWAAWNAGFDKAIWNYALPGSHLMEPEHIIDVMAQAAAAGLPPDLARASTICGLPKLTSGRTLIKLFCEPDAPGTPESHPVEWREFTQNYAPRDVEAMRNIFSLTRQLPLAEWREYWAMESINMRGVGIDVQMVAQAARLADIDRERSGRELLRLTDDTVESVDQVAKITAWLLRRLPPAGATILTKREVEINEETGVETRPPKYALTRPRVEKLLGFVNSLLEDVVVPPGVKAYLEPVHRVLQIRLYGGAKTPAKFSKMLDQHVGGMLYGQYVFNGAAQTGRASSRGVQVHNLARDALPFEYVAIKALLDHISYDTFATLDPKVPVSRILSLLIRPTFVPEPGNVFVWSDWSNIEARILPWLAGDREGALDRLEIFRAVDADPSVPDLYTRTAAQLSHLPIEDVTKPIRQRGKVAELALGFGGGVGALQAMAAGYGLYLDDVEAKQTVEAWRHHNAWCTAFWGELWSAIERALDTPRVVMEAGRIGYVYLPDYLYGSLLCILPSGRCLTYRDIRTERLEELDEDDQPTGKFSTHLRFSRGYGRVKFWPGLACENVVQAIAADILRGTLRRLNDMHYDVRLHTHDEILLETYEHEASDTRDSLRVLMQRGFDWTDGLPLMSQETVAHYYTKQGD